jgi:hypothetical protein
VLALVRQDEQREGVEELVTRAMSGGEGCEPQADVSAQVDPVSGQ